MIVNGENPVVFVGAGPGDPELITVAGKKALEQAELVVYAGSLVSREMLSWCGPDSEAVDSAGLVLEQMVELMTKGWREGRKVVRLHTGDPSLFGAIREQIEALTAGNVPWRIIPGVTSAFAAAACLGLEYTLPGATQSLILTRAGGRTPVPASEDLALLASHRASMAIYLSAGLAGKVSRDLAGAYGDDAAVAVVYRASWPQEKVVWTTASQLEACLARENITRQALILAGPGIESLAGGGAVRRSRLYHGSFSHGYRTAGEGRGD